MDPAVVGAVAAATIGVLGTLVSQGMSSRERQRESARADRERRDEREAERAQQLQGRREEFLFRALEHFAGGTQERSVGIAIAEAYWRRVPTQVDVLVPLLLNQLVYLLSVVSTAKSADAAHERQNVRRIVELLTEMDDIDRFHDAYSSSLRAIVQRQGGHGIDLSPDPEIEMRVTDCLDYWTRAVGTPAPAP
jgi:hypothetical protein